jgi:hypothetical protein
VVSSLCFQIQLVPLHHERRAAVEDAELPAFKVRAWFDDVRERAEAMATRTKRELSRAGAEIARDAVATLRRHFSWSYVAAVVLIAVPVMTFTLISSAPANGLDGLGAGAGGAPAVSAGKGWEVPLLSDAAPPRREKEPESMLAGGFGDGGRWGLYKLNAVDPPTAC